MGITKGENRMNWDLVKSYYPSPERAREYYVFVEEMRKMVGRLKRRHKTDENMRDFGTEVIEAFDGFYHGSASTTVRKKK